MKIALGQFAVSREWQENAETCVRLMKEAEAGSADVLVLPEGILARDITDPDIVLKTAQPLDGPFMARVLQASRGSNLTMMTCIHVPSAAGRVFNVLVTVRDGEMSPRVPGTPFGSTTVPVPPPTSRCSSMRDGWRWSSPTCGPSTVRVSTR